MPKRIQMTRRKGGWRKDHPEAVIVARPTKWGNRFAVGEKYLTERGGWATIRDRAHAVELFRAKQVERMRDVAELRGKDLACWCPLDGPCHADVLLEVANRPIRSVDPE
ncbi:MAG: DUF4326 domain-containing protein [Pseudomonadota bacterium]